MISSYDDIIERVVTTPIMTAAHEKSMEMGTLRNSVTNGAGNLVGFVGEGLVHEYLQDQGQMCGWTNTYDYDLILEGDITIDVKSKRTGFPPRLDYECSITAYNTKQKCDVYVFTRVRNDMTVGWILGFLPKSEYFDKATFMEKGTVDSSNGWKVKSDCYNVPINELRPIHELIKQNADT